MTKKIMFARILAIVAGAAAVGLASVPHFFRATFTAGTGSSAVTVSAAESAWRDLGVLGGVLAVAGVVILIFSLISSPGSSTAQRVLAGAGAGLYLFAILTLVGYVIAWSVHTRHFSTVDVVADGGFGWSALAALGLLGLGALLAIASFLLPDEDPSPV